MGALVVSKDLQDKLEQLAAAKQVSVEDILNGLLMYYYDAQAPAEEENPVQIQQEIAEVRGLVEKYKQPGAVWHSSEDVNVRVNAMIDSIVAEEQRKKAG
jgi:hypothetical protein